MTSRRPDPAFTRRPDCPRARCAAGRGRRSAAFRRPGGRFRPERARGRALGLQQLAARQDDAYAGRTDGDGERHRVFPVECRTSSRRSSRASTSSSSICRTTKAGSPSSIRRSSPASRRTSSRDRSRRPRSTSRLARSPRSMSTSPRKRKRISSPRLPMSRASTARTTCGRGVSPSAAASRSTPALWEQHGAGDLLPTGETRRWLMDDCLKAFQLTTVDTDGDGTTDLYGTVLMTDIHYHATQFLFGFGARLFNEDETAVILNSPEGVAGLQWLVDLEHVHKVAVPGTAVRKAAEADQTLYRRQGGELPVAGRRCQARPRSTANPDFKWFWAPPPNVPGKEPAVMTNVHGHYVFQQQDADRTAAAHRWTQFLTRPEALALSLDAVRHAAGPPIAVGPGDRRESEGRSPLHRHHGLLRPPRQRRADHLLAGAAHARSGLQRPEDAPAGARRPGIRRQPG